MLGKNRLSADFKYENQRDSSHDLTWWQGAAVYQIYPRSFADTNGDGIGDLKGITEHLDYVASLNVDAIWLSPFYQSPMRDFGYDISDFCAVDPTFGTLDDFDALLEKAHDLGLKVIIDQVYAHTSDDHEWFKESRSSRTNPKADWYVWADPKPDGSPPSNWQSVFGGPSWQWDSRREQYYLHNFLIEQPDLNVHNPHVQDAILDTIRFWLDRGVDGLRLDAVNFMMHDPEMKDNPPVVGGPLKRTRPFDFQQHIHNQSHDNIPLFLERVRAVADEYGDRFLVAEVGGQNAESEMKEYTRPPGRLHSAYGFSYLYAETLTAALIRECSDSWIGREPEGWPSWTFSNHDAPRAVSRWSKPEHRKAFAEMSMMLLVCLRGNIFVYQGEELGLPQVDVPFHKLQDPEAIANWPQTLGRDGARTPMPWKKGAINSGFSSHEPWLPVDADHDAMAVNIQDDDPTSTLNRARQTLTLRNQYPVLRRGFLNMKESDSRLVVFERCDENDVLLCAFNISETPVAWTLPNGYEIAESINLPDITGGRLPGYSGLMARKV